jgi:hypothetical protein
VHIPPDYDLSLPANWPDIDELTEFAEFIGADPRLSMNAQEVLLVLAEHAPASIAAELKARARALALPMSARLAAMYEEHADQLAEIDGAYAAAGRALRSAAARGGG